MIIYQIYLLIVKLFLAGKDASSYLLKDKSATGDITNNRIKRWHRDGVALDVLTTIPVAYIAGHNWWQVVLSSLLLRLGVFDVAFNLWGGLSATFLGSTASTDKFFAKIFGINGAIKKSLFFIAFIIILDVLKLIFHF